MTGVGPQLTIGERVGLMRRRRGITQLALAGLVGRTESWLEKIENGRASLDRLSVIQDLAIALDVSVRDLLPPDVEAVGTGEPRNSAPSRFALSYGAVNPRIFSRTVDHAAPRIGELRAAVDDVWTAYQDSRFGYVVMRLHAVLPAAYAASQERGGDQVASIRCLAYLYQLSASVLVKLGDLELARVCSERGDVAAQTTADSVAQLSLQRSVAHTLMSSGKYEDSVVVVREGVIQAGDPKSQDELATLGTLMLVGATASAHAGERSEASAFLRHAGAVAERLGRDGNVVWTSFGPTNVRIHEVTVASVLGEHRRAVDIGFALATQHMSRERRIRHQLEVARSLSRIGRRSEAMQMLLAAEAQAPDQVRRHFITRALMSEWARVGRGLADPTLLALAKRLGHAA